VSKAYAPEGKSLIAVSINGVVEVSDKTIERVRKDLTPYFGELVKSWNHLKTYTISYALPDQRTVHYDLDATKAELRPGLYMCGDHMLQGSINAAMRAGRQLGE
ncbi:FAD-dependent oxidoreductase, partial [Arthrospira platensis SPKY2]